MLNVILASIAIEQELESWRLSEHFKLARNWRYNDKVYAVKIILINALIDQNSKPLSQDSVSLDRLCAFAITTLAV
jgi:hypothetical protein